MSILLMGIGLYNAGSIVLSEKGFYGMAFVLKYICGDNGSEKRERHSESKRARLN